MLCWGSGPQSAFSLQLIWTIPTKPGFNSSLVQFSHYMHLIQSLTESIFWILFSRCQSWGWILWEGLTRWLQPQLHILAMGSERCKVLAAQDREETVKHLQPW